MEWWLETDRFRDAPDAEDPINPDCYGEGLAKVGPGVVVRSHSAGVTMFDISETWYFPEADANQRARRLMRKLAAGRELELTINDDPNGTEPGEQHYVLACRDQSARRELIRAVGGSEAEIAAYARDLREQYSDDEMLAFDEEEIPFELDLYLLRSDKDAFEWQLEIQLDDPRHWHLLLAVAEYIATELGGSHYDDLSDEELLSGLLLWSKPPPVQ
ncbi:MAG: hypothetical protein KJO07_12180 [Deltaproteobacteria bacterium]|nr:hypothetical protein [Deltaproteobacteria bacterium]